MQKFNFPRWNDLPSLNLYNDQVITYLNTQLACIYFNDEKIITKPMINNYVKTGITNPPVKKQYTKSHIAYFLVVTILKRCYTMSQISELIEIHTNMKNSSIEQAYNLFIEQFEASLNELFQNNTATIFSTKIPQQILMNHVIQCVTYKIHTEYALSRR